MWSMLIIILKIKLAHQGRDRSLLAAEVPKPCRMYYFNSTYSCKSSTPFGTVERNFQPGVARAVS